MGDKEVYVKRQAARSLGIIADPVAVDILTNAIPLPGYTHPERAFYIFGAEDSTLGYSITSWCRDIIYIPTNRCMNLAATVNVVLYDRMAKLSNSDKKE